MKTLNTDDIFFRNVGISLMALLNQELYIPISRDGHKNFWAVPFSYNFATDEGFMKDFYVGLPNECEVPVAEGTYDRIPRGIITYNSFQVMSANLTNKFVRGQFTEQERGDNDRNIITAYSAQLFSLPLSVKFDIKVVCDNLNKALKITEEMLKLYYSNRVWYFQYNGLRIPAQFQFPENETLDKVYKFTYADSDKLHVGLTVEIETYLPAFEQTSKRKASNVMERININKEDAGGVQLASSWVDQQTILPPPANTFNIVTDDEIEIVTDEGEELLTDTGIS